MNGFFHGPPGFRVAFCPVVPDGNWIWPVNQVQVQVVRVQLEQAVVNSRLGPFIAMGPVPKLAGHEQVAPLDTAALDGPAHAGFIAISCGRVDMPVAGIQGCLNCFLGYVAVWRLPGPETDYRDLDPIG